MAIFETRSVKLQIARKLNVAPTEISVRNGSGSLKYFILVQSSTVNIWENQDKIAEILPGFVASSAVFGRA